MALSRQWPVPPDSTTIHCIGDLHFGGFQERRRNKTMVDLLESRMIPLPVAHLQLGDVTESGIASEDDKAVAWMDLLPAQWYAAIGNHDLWGGKPFDDANTRTGSEAAASLGLPGLNYAIDLGFVMLLVAGPDQLATGDATTIHLPTATVDWLDSQLTAAGKDCIIACHAALYDTVTFGYSSTNSKFHVHGRTEVEDMLASNPNAKAWISGHTHTPMEDPDLVKAMTYGSNQVVAVNTSSLHWTSPDFLYSDPMRSVYVTHYADRLEVRFRDHGSRSWWAQPGGVRVVTVPL